MAPAAATDHQSNGGEAAWDRSLHRLGGDLLQSWRWGEFKRRHGWHVERVHIRDDGGEGMAQILFRRRAGLSIAYVPRGPVMSNADAVAPALLDAIDDACIGQRAVLLVIEPQSPLPTARTEPDERFDSGPRPFQASHTVKVPLVDDDGLLAQMRKDTRYNISYAQRNNVIVESAPLDQTAIRTFYGLLQETSRRNGFRIHPRPYYEDFLRFFDDQAVLLFARVDNVITAGLIAARCGSEGRSMYAGSSTNHRPRGDTALLRFEAMRWSREQGCSVFDLGGIASAQPPLVSDQYDNADPERSGADLGGVRTFKVGFGGEVVTFPATVERRYRPGLAWVVRNLNARFRTASSG